MDGFIFLGGNFHETRDMKVEDVVLVRPAASNPPRMKLEKHLERRRLQAHWVADHVLDDFLDAQPSRHG